ncbi:(2Fe-2S)-binding protein [Clostridium cylindrosporum]|uniref:Aerobic-type carbon monoxide dehydrogenase, small subunit CoxS/CutS n=1 Tax=Clostridium cylindrosporum DSM 605 TaxID=1121307 RepID=A0A0J8DD38_CLOCY|nr:2Fe-2S iron-sulfur cluster-binding protein [Clostridium cylindrosporum]KMT22163.1 aerobic-type carbon monoxide dehydrogenase, small subunit CoxS/CutS [Clostridium cylindrosporum DSM 605]
MTGTININGKDVVVEYEADDKLLELLRKLGYASVRRGCETLSCSVCTILVNDVPVNSCAVHVARVVGGGQKVTTVEGVPEEAKKVAEAMAEVGVDQCGYCAPGFVMTVLGIEKQIENPTDEKIVKYLRGNLCRCSGYVSQLRAIKKYLGMEG